MYASSESACVAVSLSLYKAEDQVHAITEPRDIAAYAQD